LKSPNSQDDNFAEADSFEMRNQRAAGQKHAVKIDVHGATPFIK